MEILDTASSPENEVNFTDVEIAVVKAALHTKLFRRQTESFEVRLPKFQALFTGLSEVFGIPEVKITADVERSMGLAFFDAGSNTVVTEKYLSLVTVLSGFGAALLHHKPELRGEYNEETDEEIRRGLSPMAFALSAFKQAAPRMFDEAKMHGRLVGVSVPYTDDGRLTREAAAEAEAAHTGEDAPPEGGTTDLPAPPPPAPPAQPRIQPPTQRPPRSGQQRPDVDPENRSDRGNGLGED